MAANLAKTFDQPALGEFESGVAKIFGKKIGMFAKLFGCAHKRLSRPFSKGMIGYRTCLECGARAKFDLEARTTSGSFYYPPPASYWD